MYCVADDCKPNPTSHGHPTKLLIVCLAGIGLLGRPAETLSKTKVVFVMSTTTIIIGLVAITPITSRIAIVSIDDVMMPSTPRGAAPTAPVPPPPPPMTLALLLPVLMR